MWPNPQETAHLVTFTEEILNRRLHFCAVEVHFDGILFLVSCVVFAIIPGGRKFVILTVEIKSAGQHCNGNSGISELENIVQVANYIYRT